MRAAFEKKLLNVRLRCGANLLLEQLGRVLIAGGFAAALAVGLERALAVKILTAWTAWGFIGVIVVLAGLLCFLRRPSLMAVAVLTDDRLGFQERFSTALALADRNDPFAKAAIVEAHEAAERVGIKGRFPVRPGRSWIFAAAAWVLAGGLVLFMPTIDLLGYMRQQQAEQEQKEKIEQASADVKHAVGPVKTAVNQLGDPELAKQLADLGRLNRTAKPEDLRRQAIRKLGDLSEKLKQMKGDKRLAGADMMQKMLKRLRGTPKGLSQKLNQALARADFERAAELIKDVQERLTEGKLTSEQKEALTRQLQDLARQLDELARQNKQMEDELEKAGLDKEMAKMSEQDLAEALKKAGLSDEKIQELLEKAAAARQACSRMARLGEAMGGCCGAGGLSGEELDELVEQLDALDAISDEMALTEASLEEIEAAIALLGEGECQGPGCQGPWAEGMSLRRGSGTGGPGRGYGPRGEDDGGNTSVKATRIENKPKAGPIIASWYFKGPQVKGEAKRKFTEAVQAGKDQAAEAVSENRIPRKYEASVKKYFGELDELGKE